MGTLDDDSTKKETYGELLNDTLPIPFATEVETYDVTLDESDIPILEKSKVELSQYFENDDNIILTNEYLFQNPNFRFTGKPVFVRTLEGGKSTYRILKPETSHIKTQEEMDCLKVFRKDSNGIRSELVYKRSNGEIILDKNGQPIPIINSKCVRFGMNISNSEENLEMMREYFGRYIQDPERISDDGHSIGKHAFDAAIALKILVDPQYSSTSYFSVVERALDTKEDGRKIKKLAYFLTTKEAETLLAPALPEKLIHTQIANEVASELRSKLNSGNKKEFNRIGNNFLIWLKEFSANEPLLGAVMLNEVKYLLKYDYNAEYRSERRYSINDIDTLLDSTKLGNTFGNPNKYHNEVQKIEEIFNNEYVYGDTDSVGKLFSFESKVDEMIKYLEYKGVDRGTLDYFKLSGQFEEVVRPVVVLKAHEKDSKVFPTTTIITSYLERYPRYFFVNGLKKALLKTGTEVDQVGEKGRECRKLLDELYVNIGKNVKDVHNVHLLNGRWVDSIAESLGRMLEIDTEKVNIYARDAIEIAKKRRTK